MKAVLLLSAFATALAQGPQITSFGPGLTVLNRGSCSAMDTNWFILEANPNIATNVPATPQTEFPDVTLNIQHHGWMGNINEFYTRDAQGMWVPCGVDGTTVQCHLRPVRADMYEQNPPLIKWNAVDEFAGTTSMRWTVMGTTTELMFDATLDGCDFNAPSAFTTELPTLTVRYLMPQAADVGAVCGMKAVAIIAPRLEYALGTFAPTAVKTAGNEIVTFTPPPGFFHAALPGRPLPGLKYTVLARGMMPGWNGTCTRNMDVFECNLGFNSATGMNMPGFIPGPGLPAVLVRLDAVNSAMQFADVMTEVKADYAGAVLAGSTYAPFTCEFDANACEGMDMMGGYLGYQVMRPNGYLSDAADMMCNEMGGFSGKPVPFPCQNGTWAPPHGCELVNTTMPRSDVPACPWYAPEFANMGCPPAYAGTQCNRTCMSATGPVDGMFTCNMMGLWEGSFTQPCTPPPVPLPRAPIPQAPFMPPPGTVPMRPVLPPRELPQLPIMPVPLTAPMTVEVPGCPQPVHPGYTSNCSHAQGSVCKPKGCAVGFSGNFTGYFVCIDTRWNGPGFTGCTPTVAQTTPCMGAPELPEGYTAKCSGAVMSGGRCEVVCNEAAGYYGVARGDAVCANGDWFSAWSGCARQCKLPSAICEGGVVRRQYKVQGFVRENVVDDDCKITDAHNGLQFAKVKCAEGYRPASMSGQSLGIAVCLSQLWYGGFGTFGAPVCEPKPAMEATCGGCEFEGASGVAYTVKGLDRTTNARWQCQASGGLKHCTCVCDPPVSPAPLPAPQPEPVAP